MRLNELKSIAKFSLTKWTYKQEKAVGSFLSSLVEQRNDPIFNDSQREEAGVTVQVCCPVFRHAFASFAGRFEVDHRAEAQFWRSGLQLLIDDFSSELSLHERLRKELAESEEVRELEERITNSKDGESWGGLNITPPTNLPKTHTWLE